MKPVSSVKGQTLQSAMSTIISRICLGQNKNNYFMWYLAWRTILQLHHSIKYSFLIAGHTKFGPDRCFGIIKKSYKMTYISSWYEFANMSRQPPGLTKHSLWGHTMEQLSCRYTTGLHLVKVKVLMKRKKSQIFFTSTLSSMYFRAKKLIMQKI